MPLEEADFYFDPDAGKYKKKRIPYFGRKTDDRLHRGWKIAKRVAYGYAVPKIMAYATSGKKSYRQWRKDKYSKKRLAKPQKVAGLIGTGVKKRSDSDTSGTGNTDFSWYTDRLKRLRSSSDSSQEMKYSRNATGKKSGAKRLGSIYSRGSRSGAAVVKRKPRSNRKRKYKKGVSKSVKKYVKSKLSKQARKAKSGAKTTLVMHSNGEVQSLVNQRNYLDVEFLKATQIRDIFKVGQDQRNPNATDKTPSIFAPPALKVGNGEGTEKAYSWINDEEKLCIDYINTRAYMTNQSNTTCTVTAEYWICHEDSNTSFSNRLRELYEDQEWATAHSSFLGQTEQSQIGYAPAKIPGINQYWRLRKSVRKLLKPGETWSISHARKHLYYDQNKHQFSGTEPSEQYIKGVSQTLRIYSQGDLIHSTAVIKTDETTGDGPIFAASYVPVMLKYTITGHRDCKLGKKSSKEIMFDNPYGASNRQFFGGLFANNPRGPAINGIVWLKQDIARNTTKVSIDANESGAGGGAVDAETTKVFGTQS